MTALGLIGIAAGLFLFGVAHVHYWRHERADITERWVGYTAAMARLRRRELACDAWERNLTTRDIRTGSTCTPEDCASTLSKLERFRIQLDELETLLEELPGKGDAA